MYYPMRQLTDILLRHGWAEDRNAKCLLQTADVGDILYFPFSSQPSAIAQSQRDRRALREAGYIFMSVQPESSTA